MGLKMEGLESERRPRWMLRKSFSLSVLTGFMLLAHAQVRGSVIESALDVPALGSRDRGSHQSVGVTNGSARRNDVREGHTNVQALAPVTVTAQSEDDDLPWVDTSTRSTLDKYQVQSWQGFGQRVEAGVNFSAADGSINIRGLDKNRVLTTVDGVRQTWLSDIRYGYGSSTRGGLDSIDFNTISSIGIRRGADSSRLGSGAMAGAVEVKTLEPEDILQGSQDLTRGWSAITKTGYQSLDQSGYLNAAVAGQTNRNLLWLFQAGVQSGHARQNRGMNTSYGKQRSAVNPMNYNAQSYMVKLRQVLEGGHQVGLSGSYYKRLENREDLSASTTEYVLGKNFSQEMSERQTVAFDYNWQAPGVGAWLDSAALKVYWQKVALEMAGQNDRLKPKPGPRSTGYPYGLYTQNHTLQEQTYGVNARAKKAIDGFVSQRWEAGMEWLGTRLEQYAASKNNCPAPAHLSCPYIKSNQADMPTTKGSQWGLWLQNTLGFANGAFELTPSIRYDHYQFEPQVDASFRANHAYVPLPSSSAGAWSPKLLATWNINSAWSVYGQFSRGFTAATATQLFSRYGTPETYLFKGNPNLKPETSQGWEFGLRYTDPSMSGALTYFDNHYSNFIQRVTLAGPDRARRSYPMQIVGFENVESVRIYGAEAKGQWQLSPEWDVHGSVAWSVGKDLNANTYLNSVPPLTAILGVGYVQDTWSMGLQWRVAAARSRVQTSTVTAKQKSADFKAPGYGVVDLTVEWRPSMVKGLTVEAGVFNLFNKTYWNALDVPDGSVGHGMSKPVDLYTQPGINVALSLNYHY